METPKRRSRWLRLIGGSLSRVYVTLLRFSFTQVLPLIMAFVVWRYLVVSPVFASDAIARTTGTLGHKFPILMLVGSWLVFAWMAQNLWQLNRMCRARRSSRVTLAPSGKRRSEVLLTVALAITAAGLALIARGLLFETHEVLGSSMLPSLNIGDELAVAKYAYRRASSKIPKRGDLVTFDHTDGDGTKVRFVKRVIGVPGDRVKMHGLTPVINGWMVPACDAGSYANLAENRNLVGRVAVEFLDDTWYLTLRTVPASQPPSTEYLVPEGEVFVLGDSRGESVDSRVWGQIGPATVSTTTIHGRVDWFLMSTSRDGSASFSNLLTRPRGLLRIEGIDVGPIQSGIARCLANRPSNSHPPKASNNAVATR